jgi:6-phosphogluconolactonase
MATVSILADELAAAEAVADSLSARAAEAMAEFHNVAISLTGGRTPERLYTLLADPARPWRARIDWPNVHLFWGDERHVPPDHPDSNYGMAARALIAEVPVPPEQVHRMRGEVPDAHEAALLSDVELRAGFARARRRGETFDVMLLGLGEDAHIASIFPASPLLDDERRRPARVAAVWASHLSAWRITLTPPALLDARRIVLLVAGAKKADAVHAALELPTDVRRWPAHLLREADDRVEWFLDRAAAAKLSATGRSGNVDKNVDS